MIKLKSRSKMKVIRHKRIRRKLRGSTEVPRLSVNKSLGNIYVQIVDDDLHKTLFSYSTLTPKIAKVIKDKKLNKVDSANLVGQEIAALCVQNNCKKVHFDRGGYPYTGRIKSLAEAARKGGLTF